MGRTQLDAALLKKMATKLEKTEQYVREQISRRASRKNIASEAAQIVWAKELGFGTATAQRRLDPHIQHQIAAIRVQVPASANGRQPALMRRGTARKTTGAATLSAAIDLLLSDQELKQRTSDLLKARKNFDRVFREATTVFDDRLQRLAQITGKVNPGDLVSQTLHHSRAILVVSKHQDEQEGFFFICKGLISAFRNPTHHTLNNKLTREDALRFCGFVDSLLKILGTAAVRLPAQSTGTGGKP